jgi:hypothetical protein
LNAIRPRLGDDKQTNFMTGQYVVGKSPASVSANQLIVGTDFHCAGANNWFIQVVGRKRWEFLMPEYSPYLWPLKGGVVNFWNGNENMARDSEHLPREFVVLNPGDVLLNPPWQWHKIVSESHPLLCPLRTLISPLLSLLLAALSRLSWLHHWGSNSRAERREHLHQQPRLRDHHLGQPLAEQSRSLTRRLSSSQCSHRA